MSRDGYVWPSGEQRWLLEAGLFDGQRAVDAFNAWRDQVKLEAEFSEATVRLLPLVYHNLHRLGVSDPLMQRLKGVYRHSWYRTNRVMHAAAPVVRQIAASGIPVLLTKGAPLAVSYYRNAALRPMADVDVVVPPSRFDDALGAMAAMGWVGARPEGDTLRFRHSVPCFGSDGAELDLHWRPMYEITADSGENSFFESAEPLEFMGTTVLQPDPTHSLFLNIVHGVRWNPASPVRWIPDALTILRVRGPDVDWERLHRLAVTHRAAYRLRLGLAYIARQFDAPVPERELARLDATAISMFERFETRVMLAHDGTFSPSAFRTHMWGIAEYGRHTTARDPVSFVLGYSHYLRYRLGLSGRRELFARILQRMRRRTATGVEKSLPRVTGMT